MTSALLDQARAALADGAVIATSGSTGVPKRVVLSAAALRASAEATAERIGHGQWVLALPETYVAGLQVLIRSVLAGTDPVVTAGSFTAAGFVSATRDAQARRATAPGHAPRLLTSLVPAQVATLLDDPEGARALAAYDTVLVGGQALPEPVRQRAVAVGATLVRTYGSSETSGGCVYDGIPLRDVRVRAVDGELHIAGPMLADGYLDDPTHTADRFLTDSDGTRWYRTGDLGTFDAGRVRVTGRADNVIISGGVNISLDRVEQVVRGIRGLEHAVVVAVADERWGQASVIVTPRTAAGTHRDLLTQARAAVADQIGRPARPRTLHQVDELPRLASGKPDRAALTRLVTPPPPEEAPTHRMPH